MTRAGVAGNGRIEGAIGRRDFTVSGWIEVPRAATSPLGDVAAAYDARERRGFTLGFLDSSPTGNHGNDRELLFALEDGRDPAWRDLGRPSDAAMMVAGLAVLEGTLYAATWEGAPSERGHVYRLEGERWIDCGSPWNCNAVSRLAVHEGRLYAGVSRLRGGGSAMPDSTNHGPGGRILRYEGGSDWTDLGSLGDADSVAGIVPFGGDLYAIPMYSEGLYRFSPAGDWEWCGSPGRRLLALGVHAGSLYGAGNDHVDVDSAIAQTAAGVVVPAREREGGGGVFRYLGGTAWESLGLQPDTTQVYSIETYREEMHIGTWPNGLVYGSGPDAAWRSLGQVGDETEVMNLFAFGGSLYAGTLPGAGVFRMDGPAAWTEVGRLDSTPDVRYRRAASMAVYDGELVVGTLPSGHVHAMRVGAAVSTRRGLGAGWHHLAAIRRDTTIELHVDGRLEAVRTDEVGGRIDLGAARPTVGRGPRSAFAGALAGMRVALGALGHDEVAREALEPRPAG